MNMAATSGRKSGKCMDNIVKLDRQTSWIKEARSMNFDFRIPADAHSSRQRDWKVVQHSFLSVQVFFLSLYLSLLHSLTPQRNRAADPGPLRAPPTRSPGHRWLKQWQVDSTLKLSIDPWEPNQTASPPSLSARDAQRRAEGRGARRARGQPPPLHPQHCRGEEGGAALEKRVALSCDFKQTLWIHLSDPAAVQRSGAAAGLLYYPPPKKKKTKQTLILRKQIPLQMYNRCLLPVIRSTSFQKKK